MTHNLVRLYEEFGQSPWLDNLKRGYLTSGQLARLRDEGIRGLTSNPTIFQKAISGSADYDAQFREIATEDGPIVDDYWTLVIADIEAACDVFAPLYDSSHGGDGFVSVEVAPDLADDSAGTETAARGLHERINRPNLMVKIPGTQAGLAPIRQMISEARNINVTLIFSLERHQEVMDAISKESSRSSSGATIRRRSPASPASSSRESTPRWTGVWTRSARPRRWRFVAKLRWPRASSPTGSSGRRSPDRAGSASPPPGLGCSGRCGRARQRRIRPIPNAVRRRADGRDTVNTLPERPSRPSRPRHAGSPR